MTDVRERKRRWWLWVSLAYAALFGMSLWESASWRDRARSLEAMPSGFSIEKREDGETLSGYWLGTRHQVATDRNDDLHWTLNQQAALRKDAWRLREVDFDNAPQGRETHWSSVYGAWIRVVGSVFEWQGIGAAAAVERANRVANLVLVLASTLALALVVGRRWGWAAALATLWASAGALPFRDVYRYGVGDHHALAILASLGCALLLALALEGRAEAGKPHRGWLIASGVSGGFALWVNAVSFLPILVSLSLLGIGFARWRYRRSREEGGEVGRAWLQWSVAGATASLAAWVVEYFPDGFAWRLEVNHPLYALAWLAGGALAWLAGGGGARARIGWALFGLVGAVAPAVVLGIWREEVFWVADPFLRALHERYLTEFQSLASTLGVLNAPLRAMAMLLPFGLLAVGGWGVWLARKRPSALLALLVVLVPSVIAFGLSLAQARWLSLAAGLLIGLAAALCRSDWGSSRRWLRWATFACYGLGVAVFVAAALVRPGISERDRLRVAEKGVAHYLAARAMGEPAIVLASPDATTNLIYYGGLRGLGTFYWENLEGLRRAAELFASPDFETAHRRFDEIGIRYLVTYSWGGFEGEYLELYRDFMGGAEASGKAFLLRILEDQEIPRWLKPIPYQVPGDPGRIALIFEKVEPMSAAEALRGRFEYMLEMGWQPAAFAMRGRMVAMRDEPVVAISLARLAALRGEEGLLDELVDRLASWEAEQVEALPWADQIRRAGVLLISGRREAARRGVSAIAGGLDRAALASLSGEELRHLLDLLDALDMSFSDTQLRPFAERLLPDRLRGSGIDG